MGVNSPAATVALGALVLGAWCLGVRRLRGILFVRLQRRGGGPWGVDIRGDEIHQGGGKGANNDQPSAHCEEKGRGKGKEGKGKKSRNKDKERWGGFIEKVVFAIKDGGMAAAFARAFGEDILPLPPSLSGDGEHGSLSSTAGDEDEDPVQAARIHELRERIAQLEIQTEQARSPHLKVGLEAVLARLRKQLLTDGDHGNDNESSSDSGSEYAGRPYDGDEDERDEELEIPIETSHGDEQL
ncbi:hypothetical protein NUW58_g7928 [Xylaria curta]|uniref:Uncharacterized protein n=1 Tax=Xylaria curta TaxID=42375 RepID=A0ACC1NCL8_9PEZI|nr:hypothetical protein NUW58_g7928 [Xylaria curta]